MKKIRDIRGRSLELLTAGATAHIKAANPDITDEVLPDAIWAYFGELGGLPPQEQAREYINTLKAGGATDAEVPEVLGFPEMRGTVRSDYVANVVNSRLGKVIEHAVIPDSRTAKRLANVMEEIVEDADPDQPDYDRASARVVDAVIDQPAVVNAIVDAAKRGDISQAELSDRMVADLDRQKQAAKDANPTSDWSGEKADAWMRHNVKEPEASVITVIGADGKTSSPIPGVEGMLRDIEKWDAADKAKARATEKDQYSKYFPESQ